MIARNNKLKSAIDLMQEYSEFEKETNKKLRLLAMFIFKRAGILTKEALTIWF
jgi:hypothetical protein